MLLKTKKKEKKKKRRRNGSCTQLLLRPVKLCYHLPVMLANVATLQRQKLEAHRTNLVEYRTNLVKHIDANYVFLLEPEREQEFSAGRSKNEKRE